MTQEEKDLLLKDLCARLPYRFIVHRYSDNIDISIDDIDDFAHFLEYSEGEEFKPYLRPMSSMTKKELKEYNELYKERENNNEWDDLAQYHELIFWMISKHLDYLHWIEKGLALEAPEGMYVVDALN